MRPNQRSHEAPALVCTLPATDVLFLPSCHCISLQYSSGTASSHLPPVPQLPPNTHQCTLEPGTWSFLLGAS